MGSMPIFTGEWVSPTDLSCFTDSLQNIHRRALLFIDNRQFVGFLQKQNWVASTDMNLLSFIEPWLNIKRCLQFSYHGDSPNSGISMRLPSPSPIMVPASTLIFTFNIFIVVISYFKRMSANKDWLIECLIEWLMISSPSKLKLKKNREKKFWKCMVINIRYLNTLTVMISLI